MERVFEIETPIGTGTVQHGIFIDKEDKNKFHCWWNGCGIGGKTNTLFESKKYLLQFIKERLKDRVEELGEQSADLRLFLREMK